MAAQEHLAPIQETATTARSGSSRPALVRERLVPESPQLAAEVWQSLSLRISHAFESSGLSAKACASCVSSPSSWRQLDACE